MTDMLLYFVCFQRWQRSWLS